MGKRYRKKSPRSKPVSASQSRSDSLDRMEQTVREALLAVQAIDQHAPRRAEHLREAVTPSADTTGPAPRSPTAAGAGDVSDTSLGPSGVDGPSQTTFAVPRPAAPTDLHFRALSGDVYRDVSDFKTSTLKWVIGITISVALALMALTWTMNDSLRRDVTGLIETFRSEVRRDLDHLDQRNEAIQSHLDSLQRSRPDAGG